jgi:hypothetical protein
MRIRDHFKILTLVLGGLLLAFAGCSHKHRRQNPGTLAPSLASHLYMPKNPAPYTGAIVRIALSASGPVVPETVLTDANGSLSSLGIDASGNYYAIETSLTGSVAIVEFAADAKGFATAIRKLSGTATGLSSPAVLAVDGAGNLAVGLSSRSPSIEFFGSNSKGNTAPTRTIAGSATALGLAVQQLSLAASGQLTALVMNRGRFQMATFAAGSSGNVASAIIRPFGPGMAALGVTTDKASNIYVTSTLLTTQDNRTRFAPMIQQFAAGETTPTRTIAPPNDPGRMAGIQVDQTGNLYVVCGDLQASGLEIQQFTPSAVDATSPTARILALGLNGANTDGSLAIY